MATPNSSHPMSLRPGPSPKSSDNNLHYRQQQSEQPDTNPPLDYQAPPILQQETLAESLERVSSYPDLKSYQDMATQQRGEQVNYGARYPSGQLPLQANHGEPSSSGALGPSDPPRMRSSNFGMEYSNEVQQNLAASGPQQPLFAQHSGHLGAQAFSQAGPSNTRPNSQSQPNPVPSIVHSSALNPATPTTTARPNTSSKSPFTTPITCPPRSRPNQILMINPTSTIALTNLLLNTLRPILPHALEVTAYNAPYPAPTAIDSTVDCVLSSETVLRDLAKYSTNNGETIQNYDALLVASYNKHPLIDALRESYDVPVIGIMEASLYVARMLGGRFGIISTGTRVKYQIDDAVNAYGLSHFFVGVESLHINPLELLSPAFTTAAGSPDGNSLPSTPSTTARPKEELHKRLAIQSKALVLKGADTIILGSEFLASNEAVRVVKDAIRDEDGRRTVNVVDAVEAGVMMLNGLIGMGVPTSKKGLYRGEREGRRGRGQTWL